MFEQYIGRVVAFVLMPVLAVAVPPAVNAVNEVLGTGFSDAQVTQYAIAAVVGVAIVVYKWLHNRGEWEILAEAGRQAEDIVESGLPYAPAPAGGGSTVDVSPAGPSEPAVTPVAPADPEPAATPTVPPGLDSESRV